MGSRAVKGVLVAGGEVLARARLDQSPRGDLGEELLGRLLEAARLVPGEVALTLATGCGCEAAPADGVAAEVPCQTLGVTLGLPDTKTIVDIGGQDSKVIFLGTGGDIEDFIRNDKCAAGTGRFLEKMAGLLGTDPAGLGRLAEVSTSPSQVGSTCVVFAETEVAGLLASGSAPADIAAGIQIAVATRIRSLIDGEVVPPVTLTGGAALIPGMARRLQAALGTDVRVAREPQFTCALGAATLARDRWKSEPGTAQSS
jgi:predicted CoA-substrate-specific enzyme activase